MKFGLHVKLETEWILINIYIYIYIWKYSYAFFLHHRVRDTSILESF